MKRPVRIAVYLVAGLVLVGLTALALPPIIGLISTVQTAGSNLARTLETPEPTPWSKDAVRNLKCKRYTDHGVHPYARGEVVEERDGRVILYRVAEGDTTIGIMERFCTPSDAHVFYANDLHLRPNPTLYVGTRPPLTGAADRIRGVAERSSERLKASAAVLAGAGHPDRQALSLLELGRALVEDGCTKKAQAALERARMIVRRAGDVAIARLVDNALQSTSFDGRLALLAAREQKVARAAAVGATNRQIAAAGHTSVRTVESQLSSVYRNLGVRSRAQLVTLLSGEPPRRA